MRLKCIHLAGFKSFVDATTVSFPSNMAAVVGPNGCGKSNVIDAVRWVMGENSARNLRGESMTDVIFNGSNTRKPVSQASIELVFDNSDGTLTSEYAAYAEISIRRKVTREGQNTYYLNNAKCRRRDITDIFLGTGLGPRSYSIIEQGMISRLIEARPDELRHYIEEAAGISKYKERRRETESRICRTQENLARLSDLREELERQLERLHRQAQAAERYQRCKEQERELKAQLTALRWRDLNEQAVRRERVANEQEVALEQLIAGQRRAEASIEQLRDRHHDLSETFNQAQGRYYAIGSEVVRVEQSIQHDQQRLRQMKEDLQEAHRQRQEADNNLQMDQAKLAEIVVELEMLTSDQEMVAAAAEEAVAALEIAEAAMYVWQQHWDAFSLQSQESRGAVDLHRSRLQHLEQNLEKLLERERRLSTELAQVALDTEAAELEELGESVAMKKEELLQLQERMEALHQVLEADRAQLQQAGREREAAQGEAQRLGGRIVSLEALQQAALNPDQGVQEWLQARGLAEHPRLIDCVRVEPGWETAVEAVLGDRLQAVLLNDFQALEIRSLTGGSVTLIDLRSSVGISSAGTLLEKVQCPVDLSPWLGGLQCAESVEVAFARRDSLDEGETFIVQDGCRVGRHYVQTAQMDEVAGGVLARGHELQNLQDKARELDTVLVALEERSTALDEDLSEHERESDYLRLGVQERNRAVSELQARRTVLVARCEQAEQRRGQLRAELAELEDQRAVDHETIGETRLLLQKALDASEQDLLERERHLTERERLRGELRGARQAVSDEKDAVNRLALRLGTLSAQRDSLTQSLERLRRQAGQLHERSEQLAFNLEESAAPLEEYRGTLRELLEQRLQAEQALKEARQAMEETDQALRESEHNRALADQQAQVLRGQLEQQRLDWQGLVVQARGLQEQLRADGYDLPTVAAVLPEAADESEWQARITQLDESIRRLGPINLAAIEEYQQQGERKAYLDAQDNDLVEALTTLENVIRKIDQETRSRFRDTFDQINTSLQELFPKVFGGGHASLELTGEDLLDTGVTIMARPPGKKNSTIHLLSGGEKALTAIALVFSIFRLNPSPFCMLDEVDAPLDDANVERYARLVKDMSSKVQFIYITHNKVAMEMADQLMGVTMHEPGCSRLVAVDVEEAMAMAENQLFPT